MQGNEREQYHQELWKSQEEEPMQMTTEEVCAMARRQEKLSVRAFWAMLGLTALFVAAFVHNLIQFRDPWLITGTAWALAVLCCISWRLVRNGPARIGPAEPCVHFLRRELERKRQGLLWIRWGVLLFFPAMLASWWGGGPVLRAKTLGIKASWLLQVHKPAPLIAMALILAFVSFAFAREARKVEREIEKLGKE